MTNQPALSNGQGEYYLIDGSPIPIIKTDCAAGPEEIREHVKSAVSRGLPEVRRCNPHKHTISIAGGGPSLNDTMGKLDGYVAAVNGAHDHLIKQGIIPNACAFLDTDKIIAGLFTPHKDVTYFVASMCHPDVFDKLQGYHTVVWHASSGESCDIRDLLEPDSILIGGGSTVTLRWINLAYVCGFRDFRIHGLDSSMRDTKHAYKQIEPKEDVFTSYGFKTNIAMTAQISDFFVMMDRLSEPDVDPIDIELYGDGLLQHLAGRKGFKLNSNNCER